MFSNFSHNLFLLLLLSDRAKAVSDFWKNLVKIQKNSLTGEWARCSKITYLRKRTRMSDKIKKSSSSLSFSLSRWFRRISTNAPSASILMIAGILYAIFILGGGLYTLINHPQPAAFVNNNFYFLYPNLSAQFISDTVISAILYGLGFVGLFMIYQSTKSAYKPRQAYMILIIGVTFLLISYIFLEAAIQYKSSGGQ